MMQQLGEQRRSHSLRVRWIVGGLAVLVLGGLSLAAFWALGGTNAFQPRTVKDLLAASADMHPVEATEDPCGDPLCVEAWRTDVGAFLRFGSEGEAEYWATVLGDDGRRWENIVLDMRDTDLTFEQKRHAIDMLFAWRDWY